MGLCCPWLLPMHAHVWGCVWVSHLRPWHVTHGIRLCAVLRAAAWDSTHAHICYATWTLETVLALSLDHPSDIGPTYLDEHTLLR